MYIGGFMKRKRSKRDRALQAELELTAISMACFLRNYLGIVDEELLKIHITHRELTRFCSILKRINFDEILSSSELVYVGKVILVCDSAGNVAPYVLNDKLRKLNSDASFFINNVSESISWSDNKTDERYDITDSELDSMSIYELENLAKYYSKTGQERKYRKIIRTIVSRDDSIQSSRQSKMKALRKKRNNNDELD